jgi:hypothetical protein
MSSVSREAIEEWPFGSGGGKLDGAYAPGPKPKAGSFYPDFKYQVQSLARLVHVEGWTVLAMWDRSDADKRPGCNSNFVAKGELDFDAIVALAQKHFPKVWKRINDAAPVVLADHGREVE